MGEEATEEVWRERLEVARRDYERERLEADQLLARLDCEVGGEELKALRDAHHREAVALTEYMRILNIYHQLKVKGKPNT